MQGALHNQIMLFREAMDVYCQDSTKHIVALKQDAEFLTVILIVTTGL
jgi:hypothetical protein